MNMRNKFEEEFNAISIYPTGGKYTCNPPVLDTDEDYLILIGNALDVFKELLNHGWEDCYKDGEEFRRKYLEEAKYGIEWYAIRKGNINLMITADVNWYMSSVAATEYCRILNLKDKDQRIRIFRNLKYREPLNPGDLP